MSFEQVKHVCTVGSLKDSCHSTHFLSPEIVQPKGEEWTQLKKSKHAAPIIRCYTTFKDKHGKKPYLKKKNTQKEKE